MNSVLICEGSTDYSLLQYYMREVYQWQDDSSRQNNVLKLAGQKSRLLTKGTDTLTIMAVGGCSRLIEGLKSVLQRNDLSAPGLSEAYKKIIIVTDRDEVGTEKEFIDAVEAEFTNFRVSYCEDMTNNSWLKCEMINGVGEKIEFLLLLLIIPFDENGAMETFLLKAIAADDAYDKNIIEECDKLVETVDPDCKYLTGRRLITKAKFDTYFSIRTPAQQFVERQNILKNVNWESYSRIQRDLELLKDV